MGRNLRLDEAAYRAIQARLRASGTQSQRTPEKRACAFVAGDRWPLELDRQLRLAGVADQVLEHRFAPPRKWRFDLAWLDRLFAVEVDGMVHRIKSRFKADLEKHQAAFGFGWRVLRVSPTQVRSGEALRLVESALARHDLRTRAVKNKRHFE